MLPQEKMIQALREIVMQCEDPPGERNLPSAKSRSISRGEKQQLGAIELAEEMGIDSNDDEEVLETKAYTAEDNRELENREENAHLRTKSSDHTPI
jgi:hypothetical protein